MPLISSMKYIRCIWDICANTASLDLGRQIHALVLKCQSKHDVAMGNTLIDMYSKSGEI
ncbi:hypothetical protein CsSME_00018597 [Camellia sinensis var. sinensis]